MQITYIIPIHIDTIFTFIKEIEMKDKKYIFYFPHFFSSIEKEKIFQKLLSILLTNSSLYLFYQYPSSMIETDWIQTLVDFTDYDDKIIWIKEGEWKMIEKRDHLEYQKMNYQKLRILLSQNELWLNTIFYHQDYPSPFHILLIKKKLLRQTIPSKHTLLQSYSTTMQPLDFILDFCVIHLASRKDREMRMREHLQKREIPFSFFEAIPILDSILSSCIFHFAKSTPNYIKGALGCKDSHYRLMKSYYEKKENQNRYLVILEDDFHFYKYEKIIEIIQNQLYSLKNKSWTLLYLTLNLSSRSRHHHLQFESISVPPSEGLATAGYIVNPLKYQDVLKVIEETKEEIDVGYAKRLKDRYYIEPYLGYPYESYSDIQQECVHYDFMY